MAQDVNQTAISKTISENDVVLFMKGTKQFPQCGFSATAVKILDVLGVPFKEVNVLEDQGIREGIKAFSNWPTIPQLYVKGEFVGGCDIMKEMYQAGELHDLICQKGIPHAHHHG
jgi:monothiol glutaredoxin